VTSWTDAPSPFPVVLSSNGGQVDISYCDPWVFYFLRLARTPAAQTPPVPGGTFLAVAASFFSFLFFPQSQLRLTWDWAHARQRSWHLAVDLAAVRAAARASSLSLAAARDRLSRQNWALSSGLAECLFRFLTFF
jgi:hypothetical protein